jgi:tetratricopeptide (TPR) repeat protein
MKAYIIVRYALTTSALALGAVLLFTTPAPAQETGGEVGVGAGIFRPKNPEAKKRTTKPLKPVTKGTGKSTARGPRTAELEDRLEELMGKGNTARDERRFAEAEQAYQSVLKLKPRDARAAYGLGNVNTDQQRWEDAEKAYRDAVAWNPSNVEALVALSVVLVQPRTGADNARRFADAESFARRAVQLDPKNAVAWDRLGVALQARGLLNDETEHAYRRAVELDPEFAVAYAHLARVLKRMGHATEAAPLYDRAVQLAKDATTLVVIAESLQAEQQWENSEPVLRKALELDARHPRALFLMGRTLVVLKHYEDAESHLKLAVEVSPRAFQAYNLLARDYLAMERYQDAEKTYEHAVEVASAAERKELSGAFGFAGVGDGYMKVKRKDDAARAYQRALELDPGNTELAQKLSSARSR